jgi:intracellular sulfur oxidation DsrE/DsrF family protein
MRPAALALALALLSPAASAKKPAAAAPAPNPDDPAALQVREGLKVVFHANRDTWKKGLPQPLFYLDRLVHTAYPQAHGVPASALDFKLVVHDAPVYWFLSDAGWTASKHKSPSVVQDHNPHKELVAKLIAAGVDIEVCAQTMAQHGVTADMLLPGVQVTPAGLPRQIDLQLLGYEAVDLD